MFLKRAILVNWGNIPQLELEFGPINLFSGGNGSGKTTAADAIQTLMTAAHENLFNYNPGQDETTQRGRGGKQVRTLASYVLGCDDGSYARPWPTDAYVAGVFHPTEGEDADAFTAIMCVRAHLDTAGSQKQARQDELMFVVVPGEQLSLSHFVKSYPDGKHVVPLTDVVALLKKEFGSKSIEEYDKKGAYLRRLYGALRGRRDAVSDREAKHAARTFANFMAYKPVKSITDFVAREILEPRDLGDAIRNVSELMKTIHHMEADTRAIREAIATLANARQHAQHYVSTWAERAVTEYAEASRRLFVNQQAYLATKKEQRLVQEAVAENQESQRQCEHRRDQIRDELIALEAQRQGIGALKDKDALEKTIADCTREMGAKARPLQEQTQQLVRNLEATRQLLAQLGEASLGVEIPALGSLEFRQLAKQLLATEASVNIDLSRLLARDWVGLEQLEREFSDLATAESAHRRVAEALHRQDLSSLGISVRDQIARLLSTQDRKRQDLASRLKQKQKDIQLLQSRKVSYPPYVEAALNAIANACPQAEPQVLCDYVEVRDPDWQMAIEGYIGAARYSIIVAQDYEAEAIRIVRSLSGNRGNRARVIQGHKAQRDAERLSLPRDSIIDVMSFSHRTAEFYLKASYGSVVRVKDAEALRSTARGITTEGLGSGNYSMWRCDLDDSELVFGQAARERALRAKEREVEELLTEANAAEQSYQRIAKTLQWVDQIQAAGVTDPIQAMLNLHRQIAQAEAALVRLDLSDFKQLEEQLAALKTQYSEQDAQARKLGEEAGRFKEQDRQLGHKVTQYADAQDVLQEAQERLEQAVYAMAEHYPESDAEDALQQAGQRAEQAGDEFGFAEDLTRLSQQLESMERELYADVMAHNQQCHQHDAIVYDTGFGERHGEQFFERMAKLRGEIDLIHNRLKNNVLVDKYDKLSSLQDSFNTAFVTNLCHSIYQAICDGKRILDDLSRELEHHRFGADRERFFFGYEWVPEYKEYWRFFKEVIEVPNLGDGSSLFEAELSEKACVVRDKMLKMLLDPDEQVALRKLNEISDYRNYRYYEIYKEPEGKHPIALSQYGTGSGGQLETPAYIIRSAAVTSAFRFNEGANHLRMVLVDEAFSKMDENRSREVINYLTETLGLQLLFIMPSSKSGPFMDLISNQFVFSKCPTATPIGELNSRVLLDRKTCNRDKIKQLWANHRKTVRHQAMLDFMEDITE